MHNQKEFFESVMPFLPELPTYGFDPKPIPEEELPAEEKPATEG